MHSSLALAFSVAVALAGSLCSTAFPGDAGPPEPRAKLRLYAHLLDPRENPHDDRRPVRPPGWDVFGGRTRFTSLRGFAMDGDRIVGFAEEIEKYVRTHELGEVIWPSYSVVFASNLEDLAEEIRRRDLFLFDIWGYVPGSGPGGYWQAFRPPPAALEMLAAKLGSRWLGMDIGEQDGRYVGGYASQMHPASGTRLEQYLNFGRHFERMGDDLGNRLSVLVSLNFGHYLIKEGTYATIGAETAQGLPNGQVYYSFIRGAGKQYGVPWFGNASIYNRWGYKVYGAEGPDHGPTKGSSLALLKRLLYSHILYDCVFVGFENGWLEGEKLSPIGRIQKAARKWVGENGRPGVHMAPVALLVDFLSGWTFPRHLYSGDVFRVWGNLPYGPGDHLTDGVLEMLYPGYADSSYFHDESGFTSPTPYGDAADCLLSDAPAWLLDRYALAVVAGDLSGGLEVRDKLEAFLAGGGRLVIAAGSLANLPGGLGGVRAAGPARRIEKGKAVRVGGAEVVEDLPFDLVPLDAPAGARTVASAGDLPAAVEVPAGRGTLTVLASPFGIPAEPAVRGPVSSAVDAPLPRPYPLLRHVRAILDAAFRSAALFEAGEGLSLIACRRGEREYVLGISNPSLAERPIALRSLRGPVASIRELPLDRSEVGEIGHLPLGFEKAPIGPGSEVGADGRGRIAGGDVRIFLVKLEREEIVEVPKASPPPRTRGRALPLRAQRSIREEVLARPTFFDRFDGVVVDGRYFLERDREALRAEGGWIRRQGLRVVADLTSSLNLYPGLRLLENDKEEHVRSLAAIEELIARMPFLGARDLVLALHRHPENNYGDAEARASFESTLRRLAEKARPAGIAIHLRLAVARPPWSVDDALGLVSAAGAPNLDLAPSTALLLGQGADPAGLGAKLRGKVGLWLAAAPGAPDLAGRAWNFHAPLHGSGKEAEVGKILAAVPEAPVAIDGITGGPDDEYLEAKALDAIAPAPRTWGTGVPPSGK